MINMSNKIALKSKFRFRVGAVITKSGGIISTGFSKTNRGSRIITSEFKCWESSLHAEADAILKILKTDKIDKLVGATIYVSRLKADGKCGLAKPCKYCNQLIQSVGIKKVVYTTNDGTTDFYYV
jgi:deoxycytidylate deaminase